MHSEMSGVHFLLSIGEEVAVALGTWPLFLWTKGVMEEWS